jgi:hypothetical protein
MVALALNQTVSTQKTPSISVDGGLSPGRYRIQLVVTDSTNGQSTPTFVQLTVVVVLPPPPPPPPSTGGGGPGPVIHPEHPVIPLPEQPIVLQPPVIHPPIIIQPPQPPIT